MSIALAEAAVRAAPAAGSSVVVVVLNWCNETDTAACLRSVLASDHPALTVLLVDNGSADGSGPRLAARFPEVAYLQTGDNLGYAGGNNRGFAWAQAAGADYVLVLNNDAEIAPDCVSRLVAAAADDAVGVVAPKILARERPEQLWYAGGALSTVRGTGLHWREGERDDPRRDPAPGTDVSFATGCCFLITARALTLSGGFEESYFAYVEDVDLSFRVTAAHGLRIVYEPRARVLHRLPARTRELTPFHIVQRDRNRRRFARLRLTPARRAAFAAWYYPTRVLHLARYVLAGDRARAAAVMRGMLAPL